MDATLCPACQAANSDGARFCSACGAALPLRCSSCDAANPPAARFCNACGSSLGGEKGTAAKTRNESESRGIALGPAAAPDTSIDGERKLVTALFVDIIGSTILEQDLDPEEARRIIDPALELMIEAVRRYDGYVVQSTGDGVFALFGAPLAHEDHAQRSLYTALRLHEDMRRYSDSLREEGSAPIQVRIGVNTGEVVVRSIRTGERQTEYTPIGHTVNLASRLQALASSGSTVISDSTRKLVEGYFALKPLGPTRVKGVSDSVPLFEVTGLGPLRTRLEKAAGRGLSKFVGRDKEKELFRQAETAVRQGEGRVVAVEAEPGVGKSRLFFEFKTGLAADCLMLEALSVSHGKSSAFLPIIDLLQGYFCINRAEDASLRREKISSKMLTLGPELQEHVPYIAALLQIEQDKESLAAMDAQLRRARTLQALVQLLLAEAQRQPLIVIVEDLHWLDDESRAFLDLLADAVRGARVLLLVSYRPEYQFRWAGKEHCTRFRLEPLGRENAVEMLSQMLGQSPDLSRLKHKIIETTGGTPFFIEETVQSLFDEGALVADNGMVQLRRPLSSLRIPPTVQAILAARIDRLRNDEKNLLQTLAVLGREFLLSLVRAVAGRSEDELDRLIDSLERGEFVYEQPSISDVEYIFKHALTQEVAYNSVLLERRRQLHESVGHAIELLYSDSLDDHLADLAYHFSRSGNRYKAVEYLYRAATQSMSRGALAQSIEDLKQALHLLREEPVAPKRDLPELQVLNALGTGYIAVRGYASPDVGPVFQAAREICARVGDPQQQFATVFGNFAWRIVRGEMELALDLAREAISLAEKFDDPGMWMEALFLLGVTLFYRGDFSGARAQHEKALAQYDDPTRNKLWAARVGEDAGVTHRCYLALSLWHLGHPDQALRMSREARDLAHRIEHPFSLAYAQHHTSWLYELMRMPAETMLFSEEQMQLSQERGFPLFSATSAIYNAAGRLSLSSTDSVLPELERGLDQYRETGARLALPYYLGLLAKALVQSGHRAAAKGALVEALGIAEESHDRCHQAELRRLQAELSRAGSGDHDQARQCYLEALAVAGAQGSKASELRAAIGLAELDRQAGTRSESGKRLAELYDSFTEGFNTPDLRKARSLIVEFQLR